MNGSATRSSRKPKQAVFIVVSIKFRSETADTRRDRGCADNYTVAAGLYVGSGSAISCALPLRLQAFRNVLTAGL